MSRPFYVTTAIPYVNARPHLGFALEIVQADVLARHHRRRGQPVRFLTGTDDNSLKNVQAAEAEGVAVRELVDRNAGAYAALRDPLDLSFDDFISTSSDPRHRAGVERLWRACLANGDLYRKHYQGLYCVGCEQFYAPAELVDGRCPEHGTVPELVAEENWFFRLSRYRRRLGELIESGALRVQPASRRNEVLGFIAGGLEDFSVSRSASRSRGWGIGVPDDPEQVIYVWFDALANYITALGYGTGAPAYHDWWVSGDRRVHVIGKGILRFHAAYWPGLLLSAGAPLPTDILVHDYLTVEGRKLSKSNGNLIDPVELAGRFGADAVRWWLLREVPRAGDADFTLERLAARSDEDLANRLGNLVNRVVSMVHRYRGGAPHDGAGGPGAGSACDAITPAGSERLVAACRRAPALVDEALEAGDFRRATAAVWAIVEEGNRYVEAVRPWELARAERTAGAPAVRLDAALGVLLGACRRLAEELAPFLPRAAARIAAQCAAPSGRLPEPRPLFPRVERPGLERAGGRADRVAGARRGDHGPATASGRDPPGPLRTRA
jgi:methionyl-tRNA synthetase